MDVENQPAAEASKTCIACGITKPTSEAAELFGCIKDMIAKGLA